jgi:hypothetical protein
MTPLRNSSILGMDEVIIYRTIIQLYYGLGHTIESI